MKKFVFAIGAAVCAVLFFLVPVSPLTANAAETEIAAYSYDVLEYDVGIDVSEDCVLSVEETLKVSFSGYDSHGIIRDFPLGGGVRYTDFEAECDHKDFAPYFQTDELGVLSWYLRGDGLTRGQERTYTLRYTIHAFPVDGVLPVDVLGYGMQSGVKKFSARVTVPDGCGDVSVYSGREGTSGNSLGIALKREGNTFTLASEDISALNGVTLNFSYGEGALGSSLDEGFLYGVLIAAAVILIALLVKLLLCRQPTLIKTVNFSAPENYDPLSMGYLIDKKVDSEDLGALIFWLADKGYLTIDMRDKDDPLLIRTEKKPEELPPHIRLFYDGLFQRGEAVLVSSLNNSFYGTAEAAKSSVSAGVGAFFTRSGKVFTVLLGVLSVLLVGGFFLLYSILKVGGFFYWLALALTPFSYAIGSFGGGVAMQRRFKWSRPKRLFTCLGSILLGCLVGLVSVIDPPAFSSSFAVFTACCLVSVAGCIGGSCLVRTKAYTEKLGQILGFKDFILYTEKDRIAVMIESDPQLYYRILPYAQVLGVTDVWTDKFDGLDFDPPYYMNCAAGDFLFHYTLFRTFTAGFARAAVSRPSVQGKGGFGGGGFGGGFGGGGFGGGGTRGC